MAERIRLPVAYPTLLLHPKRASGDLPLVAFFLFYEERYTKILAMDKTVGVSLMPPNRHRIKTEILEYSNKGKYLGVAEVSIFCFSNV